MHAKREEKGKEEKRKKGKNKRKEKKSIGEKGWARRDDLDHIYIYIYI